MKMLYLMILLVVSCSKPSDSGLKKIDFNDNENLIELEPLNVNIDDSTTLPLSNLIIPVSEVFSDIKIKQKIIIKNNTRSSVNLDSNFSELNKISYENNCAETLAARTTCSIVLTYEGQASDIVLDLIEESFTINGGDISWTVKTKPFPDSNNKVILSDTQFDFGMNPSSIVKKYLVIKNKDLRNENLDISLTSLGNFTISRNTCSSVLRSRKSCLLEIQYSDLGNAASQTGMISIEGQSVSLSVNSAQSISFFDSSSFLSLSPDSLTVSRIISGTNYDTAILQGLPAGSGKKYYVEFSCNPCNGFIYLGANISATPPNLEPTISDFPLMDVLKDNNIDEVGVILGITSSQQSLSLNGGGGVSVPNQGHGNASITIGIAYDGNTNRMWLSRNGVWLEGDAVLGTGGQSFVSIPASNIYFGVASYAGNSTAVFTKLDPSDYELIPSGFELK